MVSLALIFLILMHSGKGGGLSDMFGGSVGQAAAGSTVVEKNLDRITITVAVIFSLHHCDFGPAPAVTPGHAGGRARAAAPGSRRRPRGVGGFGTGSLCALVALCVVVSACGSDSGGASALTKSRGHSAPLLVPTVGGSATVALDQVPTSLNVHTVAGDTPAGLMVGSAIWAQVFRVGPNLTPQLDTNIVDSAEVINLAPQTVVYQIDPRAVWSDGVPISAADFMYAWQSQKGGATDVDGTPDSVASTLGYRDIASLTGSNDGRTVTVVFRTPFADWPSLFDDLLPAHIAEAVGWNRGFDQFATGVFVSGGPWEVVSWQPGSEIVLGRNPRWWGSTPNLDRIVVRAVSGDTALTSALGQNQVQVAYPSGFDQSFMAQASTSSVLQTQTSLGTRMLQLEFNVRHAPLTVQTVRQGIAHAIDRAGIVESVGQPEDPSVWEDNNHLIPNAEPGYADDAVGYETRRPGDVRASARAERIYSRRPRDMDHAREAGESQHRVGRRRPVVGGRGAHRGGAIGRRWLRRGDHSGVDDPVVFHRAPHRRPSISRSSRWTPARTRARWAMCSQPLPPSSARRSPRTGRDTTTRRSTRSFTQAVQELAPPQAHGIYQQIDQALWTAMPDLPLFAEPTMLVWSSTLSGVIDDPGGTGPFWNIRQWALRGVAPAHGAQSTGAAIGSLQHRALECSMRWRRRSLWSEWRNRQTR